MTLDELNAHYALGEKLIKIQTLIESLRARTLGAVNMDGMPHGTGVSARVGNLAVEIVDLEARAKYLSSEVAKSEAEISGFIDSIEDDQTRMIFRLRFIRFMAWGEVAYAIGGNTEDSVKKICYRYLDEVVP